MTVSSSSNRIQYAGGSTTYTFPYLFYADSELTVYVGAVVKVLNTDYTVSGAGNSSGGTVTFTSAPSDTVTIVRSVPLTQTTDYVNNSKFDANVLERNLDELTFQTQQQAEETGRTLKLSPVSAYSDVAVPDPAALEFLRWNAAKTALENVDLANLSQLVTQDPITTFLKATTDSAALDALGSTTLGKTLFAIASAAAARTAIGAQAAGSYAALAGDATQAFKVANAAAADEAAALGQLPFTELYESPEQTITSDGVVTLAHGLSTKPTFVYLALMCKTAELGFSVGQEIPAPISAFHETVSGAFGTNGPNIATDGSNITIYFPSGSIRITAADGTNQAITNANWTAIARAAT